MILPGGLPKCRTVYGVYCDTTGTYIRVTSEKKKKKSGVCDVFWARTEEVGWDTGVEEKFKFLIVPKEIQRNVQTTESNK